MNRISFYSAFTLAILGMVLLSACFGGGGGTPAVTVTIQATGPTTIDAGQTVALTAKVTNDSATTPGVTWTITSGPGAIAAGATATAATFDAPAPANVNAAAQTVITATSNADKTATKTITITTNPLPTVTTTTLAAATEFVAVANETLAAAGGSGALTWALAGGTTPPAGLTLNTNGTVTGAPTGPKGTFNFKVTVTDSANPPVTSPAVTISITINWPPAPTIAPTSLPSAPEGGQYSQTVTVSNGHAPYTITVTGNPPAGITATPNNAAGKVAFAGIPTGPANTTSNFTINVTDSSNPAQQVAFPLSILVTPPTPLALGPAALPDATEGTQYSQNVTASGGIAPYTFSAVANLPAGLGTSVNGAVLTISGKPAGPAGAANFTVTVKDSSNPQQTKSVTYTPNVNRPPAPTLAPATLPDGVVGTMYNQTVTASGGLPPYLFQVSGLPTDGLSATVNATNVVVSGKPTSTQTGLAFSITVTDSSNPAYVVPANYVINVNNTPPVCVLLGQYALLATGTVGGGAAAIAGSVTVAHDGTVIGAVDFKTHSKLAANQAISQGTCTNGTVPNTGRLVFLVNGNVTETIDFALRADGLRALIEWQDTSGVIGSGQLETQTTPTVNFHGSYGFGIVGEDGSASHGRLVAIGAFCSNGQGNVGYLQADIDDNDTNIQFVDNGGVVNAAYPAPDSNGRTQMTSPFTFINGTPPYEFTLTLYVVSGGKAFAVETSPLATNGQVLGGVITGQAGSACLPSPGSFTKASLQNSVFAARGDNPTKGIEASVGVVNNINAAAGTASLTVDTNQGGTTDSFTNVAVTYSVTPGGHVTINFTDPNNGKAGQVFLYLDGVGDSYVLSPNKAVSFGSSEPQAAGPFNDQSIGGTYAAGALFLVTGQTTVAVDEATVNNQTLTISVLGTSFTGTYQMDASGNGRGTAVFNGGVPFGSTNAAFYVYNKNKIVGIGTTGTSPIVVRLEQ